MAELRVLPRATVMLPQEDGPRPTPKGMAAWRYRCCRPILAAIPHCFIWSVAPPAPTRGDRESLVHPALRRGIVQRGFFGPRRLNMAGCSDSVRLARVRVWARDAARCRVMPGFPG